MKLKQFRKIFYWCSVIITGFGYGFMYSISLKIFIGTFLCIWGTLGIIEFRKKRNEMD